eukprot:SAG11_NODE_14681_length_603_cov_1.337302_1_plen_62_part_10
MRADGRSWEQVAPRRPFIPRGAATIRADGSTDPQGNAFDSRKHTTLFFLDRAASVLTQMEAA